MWIDMGPVRRRWMTKTTLDDLGICDCGTLAAAMEYAKQIVESLSEDNCLEFNVMVISAAQQMIGNMLKNTIQNEMMEKLTEGDDPSGITDAAMKSVYVIMENSERNLMAALYEYYRPELNIYIRALAERGLVKKHSEFIERIIKPTHEQVETSQ
jgi:hypothetical protein